MNPSSWLFAFCAAALLMSSVGAEEPGNSSLASLSLQSGHKVISGVPILGWGTQQETTFAGALSAALAVTKHPCDYAALMGVTGLGFRTRWFHGPKEDRWNGSSPIGEGDETFALARRATGWELKSPLAGRENKDPDSLRTALVAGIDAGQPVLSYGTERDLGVVFGYEDGGKILLSYDYYNKGETVRLTPEKIIDPGIIVLGKHSESLSSKEAMLAGLKASVKNWKRSAEEGGGGKYGYGEDAYTRWIGDVKNAGDAGEEDRKKLFHASWWNLDCLFDARSAARSYLSQNAKLLKPEAQEALNRATHGLDDVIRISSVTFMNRDVFLGPWTGKTFADWTPEVRKNEVRTLEECRQADAKIVEALKAAIQAEEKSASIKDS